jgi:DNA-directed RNA polymerase subunit RPC12/RpoP
MIKCPNCNGELKFDIEDQEVECPFCSSKFNPKEIVNKVNHAKEYENMGDIEGKSYTCSQCGAQIMSFDETAVTFCNFCDSQTLIESKMNINSPNYIIPFKKTKEQCIDIYKKTLNKALFAPKYMKDDIVFNKIRGIFMPYGIYKVGCHENIKNKGKKYSHRAGNYDVYNDYEVTARVDAEYDGISFDLVSKYYDNYSNAIPYDYSQIEDFNYNYLAGFYADVKDVNDKIYEDDAEEIGTKDSTNHLLKQKEFIKYGVSNPKAQMKVLEKKNGLFPVYFACIKDKSGTRVHYAIINGQTGKVAMDIPIDFAKYLIVSLIVAIPIFLILNFFPVITNFGTCLFAAIGSLISLIITISQIHSLNVTESYEDDQGYYSTLSLEEEKKLEKKYKYFKEVLPLIIAMLLPILTIFIDPIMDIYFYGVAIFSIIIILLSFSKIIKRYNLLSSRPLPQLNKRGGDLHE